MTKVERVKIPVKIIIGDSISYTLEATMDIIIGTKFVGLAAFMEGEIVSYNELGKALLEANGLPGFLRELADYCEAADFYEADDGQ